MNNNEWKRNGNEGENNGKSKRNEDDEKELSWKVCDWIEEKSVKR